MILPLGRKEVCEEGGDDYEDEADYYACAVGGERLAVFLGEWSRGRGGGNRPVRHFVGWESGSEDGVGEGLVVCVVGWVVELWRCKVCIILAWFCAYSFWMLTPEVHTHDIV